MTSAAVGVGPAEAGREAARAEAGMSWAGAISLLVLVVWLVPIKIYRLPVALPISLELYRLLIILFVGAWIVAMVTGTRGVSAAGLGKPIVLLAAVGLLSILANVSSLSSAGL